MEPRDKLPLKAIKEHIAGCGVVMEARRIIKEAGLTNADDMLAHLGFIVMWKGLDPSAATIALQ